MDAFQLLNLRDKQPVSIAFTRVVSYARCMENLTHDELARLTPPERLTLISQLWDSLEDNHLP
jgi:hypothetical protein